MKNKTNYRPKSKAASSISSILPDLLKKKKIDLESGKLDIFKIWPDIVGEQFKKYTKPITLNKGTLIVEAIDAAIIQELSMNQNAIQKKLNESGFGGKISKLKFISGNPKNFK